MPGNFFTNQGGFCGKYLKVSAKSQRKEVEKGPALSPGQVFRGAT
jgi:hypothetical protein